MVRRGKGSESPGQDTICRCWFERLTKGAWENLILCLMRMFAGVWTCRVESTVS